VARMGKKRGACGVLEGKPEGKRPLDRPMRKQEGNIKTHRQKISCGGEAWSGLIWLTIGTCGRRLHEPSSSIKYGELFTRS
jgi:hypothetical protein